MVARMMRWRPWPPIMAKKFEVRLNLRRIEGFNGGEDGARVLMAEVRWKGPKLGLGALRRTVKRNCTKEEEANGTVVEWNEDFESICSLTFHKENAFHPWEIEIRVFNGLKQGSKNKTSVIGMASLNLAEFACTAQEEVEINLPLLLPGVNSESHPSLNLALSLLELRTSQESSETVQRSIVPAPLSPSSGDALPSEKDELSALKAGLRKVKILTDFVSTRKAKKTCREDESSEGRCSARSEDADYPYPFDTDSLDDDLEGELEEGKENSSIRKSFSYGTLATANYVGGSFYSDMRINGEYEDWVYYSHRKSDVACSHAEDMTSSVQEQTVLTSKRSILPWRKRKLSFRSPKAKGEPLLKKCNGEEGGDDIDYDRRQLSSSDESLSGLRGKVDEDAVANSSSLSDFGDDNFAVGSWESKEVVSRDGQMKLSTQVFFASIDQRSERAAGESACTALVAVIADWFQSNRDSMPIKSQFDSLIREGSLEWRNLCKNQTYRERFPDKHFDLETVLQAKIRPLSVAPGKSFIGFFHPEGMDDNSGFDFLHGAMSFDSIWDEISRAGSECYVDGNPQLYIVSWNDHFFVLKVERDAYYIIDTLGERLFEGCDQAYILKFDANTLIHRIPAEDSKQANGEGSKTEQEVGENDAALTEQELVCKGKESCKEYIKSFLAAIPIRELQVDIKKGLMTSTPLHHRLQIELHYTEPISALVLSQPEEFVQQEEQNAEIAPMSPVEEFSQRQLLAVEEAVISPREESNDDEESFLRKEESVGSTFSLTPAVEVV
ncbi:uncharacterized protein A4U43_C03F4160 [Asparagus officinalis]|uniref:C2 NT-type domain-containing protein n=1 Tax=Asparagus officinalis TaxID=4686 RepID=A0A5P1F909_ASPOF|nr:uncharacterized protein LOC109832882 isoform X1 [Asparagus officinalis]XP_020255935.1 uncharacterized protein LOC109832882 isoform X2 [Asparagus officinalis]ONK74233.1 uncharacterized protein A4U43_C03F4160 [Asparagus officinalis]